ncbi:MAG: MarR family transcriptional regulator [Burkholderiaceae bacterium]
MLTCTTRIEDEIRRRLLARFGISMARFDYLAQLQGEPNGLDMKALAQRLMVTSGNVTGLTNELQREGLVTRGTSSADRRVRIVRLTAAGRRLCRAMAREHEQWVLELFSSMDAPAIDQIYERLGTLRAQLTRTQTTERPAPWNAAASCRADMWK